MSPSPQRTEEVTICDQFASLDVLCGGQPITQPYPGLRPFHVDENEIFFGRETQIDQLGDKLAKHRFVAVIGPSGCGKSSLVKAGLLPELPGLITDTSGGWHAAVMRPGAQPIASLARALVIPENQEALDTSPQYLNKLGRLYATLRRGEMGLMEALPLIPMASDNNLLILVDQFEEIFRYRVESSVDEADAFVSLLLRTIAHADKHRKEFRVFVVITMRSDFIGDCNQFTGLPEEINESQFLTPRLTRDQRRAAIVGPARHLGSDIESALVNRLLNDMGDDPDQLPIMQHALMRLWSRATSSTGDQPESKMLSVADYESLGGWNDTLSNHANDVFKDLTAHQQQIAEQLFRCLVDSEADQLAVRRPARLGNVAEVAATSVDEVKKVADQFRQPGRSFLTPPADIALDARTVLDISHESLIRQWDRLRDWARDEEESAKNYRHLEDRARRWEAGDETFMQPPALDIAVEWRDQEQPNAAWARRYGQHFDLATRYLAQSERKHKLATIYKVAVIVVVVVAIVVTLILTARHRIIVARQRDVESSLALQVMRQALDTLATGELEIGCRRLLRAAKTAPSGEAGDSVRRSAQSQLAFWMSRLGYRYHHDQNVVDSSFHPDGEQLLTISDKIAQVWDAKTHDRIVSFAHDEPIVSAVFSADGATVLTCGGNKAYIWDVTTGEQRETLDHEHDVIDAFFHSDGETETIFTRSDYASTESYGLVESTISEWEFDGGKKILTELRFETPIIVLGKLHGQVVAFGQKDDELRLTDVRKKTVLWKKNSKSEGAVTAAAFSLDGETMIYGSGDSNARLRNSKTGELIHTMQHLDPPELFVFSPNGRTVISAGRGDIAMLWQFGPDESVTRGPMLNHGSLILTASFDPTGDQIVTGAGDGTVRLWDTATGERLAAPMRHLDMGVTKATFAPSGSSLLCVSNNIVTVWPIAVRRPSATLDMGVQTVHLAVVTDGETVVAVDADEDTRCEHIRDGSERNGNSMQVDGILTCAAIAADRSVAVTARHALDAELFEVQMWNTTDGTPIGPPIAHHLQVMAAALSTDGDKLLTVTEDGLVRLWDTVQHTCTTLTLGLKPSFNAIAMSPNGGQILTGGKHAQLWDVLTGEPIGQPMKHEMPVMAVAFSSNGHSMLTGSADGRTRLWDAVTQELIGEPLMYTPGLNCVAFSPAGKKIIVGGNERIWMYNVPASVDDLAVIEQSIKQNVSTSQWETMHD